jgi:phosphatidylglycerol:prolipoprotein diacylglycerol transferase
MHPVLFNLFGYPVHLYAVMIATGFVVGIWLSARYAERTGYDRDMILDLCWWLLVSGLIGSRIVFMIVNWDQYYYPCVDYEYFNTLYPEHSITEPDCTRVLRFWNGGLVFYGGVIGAMLTMVWFLRREGVRILPIADILISSLAIGQFFGRLGCLVAGCCWGKLSGATWTLEYPARTMVFNQHYKAGLVGHDALHSLPVHPTQLYDSLCGLLLFCILIYVRHRKRFHGQVFIWWMFLYPLFRSSVEIFRGDNVERGFLIDIVIEPLNQALGFAPGSVTFLSTSQFISLGMMTTAAILLWKNRLRPLREQTDS